MGWVVKSELREDNKVFKEVGMSGRTIALLSAMCAVLMLGACSSTPKTNTPMVFDESLPMEESVHIYIEKAIQVITYNGIPVPVKKSNPLAYWLRYPDNIVSEWRDIVIPPGEVEFFLHVGGRDYYGRDLLFRYTFEPSGDLAYILVVGLDFSTNTNGLWVYKSKKAGELTTANPPGGLDEVIRKSDRITFVPFLKLR